MSEERKEPVLDITTLDTYALLSLFIGILSAQAWQHMGLRVKPGAQEIEKDFERARVAIDCVAFLVEKLESHLPDAEKDKLKSLVADLQINFVRLMEKK